MLGMTGDTLPGYFLTWICPCIWRQLPTSGLLQQGRSSSPSISCGTMCAPWLWQRGTDQFLPHLWRFPDPGGHPHRRVEGGDCRADWYVDCRSPPFGNDSLVVYAKYWAGLFCLLGHMFPCMFHFKGKRASCPAAPSPS